MLTGGVLAAVIGPALAAGSKNWLAPVTFAGSYLVVAILSAISLVLLVGLLRDLPVHAAASATGDADALPARPLGEIMRQPIYVAALANNLKRHAGRPATRSLPSAQVVFCMDDREEGTRRHLEEIAPTVETFGAAGFFGIAMRWRGIDDATATALCPVVVTPQHQIDEWPRDAVRWQVHAGRRERRLRWRERLYQQTPGWPGPRPAGAGCTKARCRPNRRSVRRRLRSTASSTVFPTSSRSTASKLSCARSV